MDAPTYPSLTFSYKLPLKVLNSRVRNRGLSAKEIVFKRDQHSLEQLGFNDKDLAKQQSDIRLQNHAASAKSKAPGKKGTIAKFGIH